MRPKDGYRAVVRQLVHYSQQKIGGLLERLLSPLDPIIFMSDEYEKELRKSGHPTDKS